MRNLAIILCMSCAISAAADDMTGTGFLANRRERTVQAELTGSIAEVFVEEGDFVKQGGILAEMSSWALTRRVQRAEARLKSSVAELRLAEVETNLFEQRQAWLSKAKPSNEVQNKQHETHLQIELSKLQVVQGKENVEANTRELKTLLQMQERLIVRSPFDGKVSVVRANVGDVIAQAGIPLITVSSRNELVAHIRFPVRSIKTLHAMRHNGGAPLVTLRVEALDIKVEGHVATISQNVDTSSQTIEATIVFENKNNSLMRPGMKVTATLIAARENSKSVID